MLRNFSSPSYFVHNIVISGIIEITRSFYSYTKLHISNIGNFIDSFILRKCAIKIFHFMSKKSIAH